MIRAAYFPMYNQFAPSQAVVALWRSVAAKLQAAGIDAPADALAEDPLNDNLTHAPWLVHYCSYPYLKIWQAKKLFKPLASFDYDLPNCENAQHRSVLVVPIDSPAQTLAELKGKAVAINGYDSNTGMNLLRREVAELADGKAFFSEVVVTGAHSASLRLVAEKRADLASIDAVTFGYLQQSDPELTQKIRIIGTTRPCPNLPLFVPIQTPDETCEMIRGAFAEAIAEGIGKDVLRLRAIRAVDDAALEISRDYEREAAALGYPELI